MGATLSSRAEWISASENGGKLNFSKSNESLLQEIVRNIEDLAKHSPAEAEVTFKKSFKWHSSLELSSFDALKQADFVKSELSIESMEKDKEGKPLLSIIKTEEGLDVQVSNFKYLVQFMSCAGQRKLKETQLCLEANPDPVACIIGSSYPKDGNKALMDAHNQLTREKAKGNDSIDDSSFRLLLLINNLDIQLMQSSLKQLGKEVRLTPSLVQSEMELLDSLCGGSYSCLKSIEYTTTLAFTNGCRAPPWRQVLGDICYIMALPHDADLLHVTASTEGYFVNNGIIGGQQQYDKIGGDTYATLVALLKNSSKVFAENINKQVNFTTFYQC
jgi:hypothetical protein